MTRIIWTSQAVEDVEAIRDYVARDSHHYAALLAARLVSSVESLAAFPDSGRIVPEIGEPELRELIVGSYRIVYQVQRDLVTVLTVFHAARLFPGGLEEDVGH